IEPERLSGSDAQRRPETFAGLPRQGRYGGRPSHCVLCCCYRLTVRTCGRGEHAERRKRIGPREGLVERQDVCNRRWCIVDVCGEPPRISWRLQTLRGWGHDKTEPVLPGSA